MSDEEEDPPQDENNNAQEEEEEDEFEWEAFLDADGRTYYYNAKTGESQWTEPEGPYKPVQPQEDDEEGGGGGEDVEGDTAAAAAEEEGQADAEGEGEHEDAQSSAAQEEEAQGEADAATTTTTDQAAQEEQEPSAEGGGGGEGAGGWVAYTDDEGREYYYNETTGETQWDRPEEMGPPPAVEDEAQPHEGEEEEGAGTPPDVMTASPPLATAPSHDLDEEQDSAEAKAADVPKEQEEDEEDEDAKMDVEEEAKEDEGTTTTKQEEEEEDAVSKASKALSQPDAILEPDCLTHLGALVSNLGGAIGGPRAIKNLVASYHGETNICGLLSTWLVDLLTATTAAPPPDQKSQSTTTPANNPQQQQQDTKNTFQKAMNKSCNQVRQITENVLCEVAMETFTKTGGDNILKLSKGEAAFLESMMDEYDRWRHLLIDLSAKHKDSALLMYCLQSISKRGHHREIAQRIDQSDYFGVFNAMLASELSIVGKMAVGETGGEGNDSATVTADVKRTCTSTSYTYLYAMEALQDLVKRAQSLVETTHPPTTPKGQGLLRAIRKWERLKEELEETMLQKAPSSKGAAGDGAILMRKKRRVEVALAVSELQQKPRRKWRPDEEEERVQREEARLDDDGGEEMEVVKSKRAASKMDPLRESLETTVLSLLRKHSLGMPVDAKLAQALLHPKEENGSGSGSGRKEDVGSLLVAHPTAIHALLVGLFYSGPSRVRVEEVRRMCATLVARAAITCRNIASGGLDDGEDTQEMEDTICKNLLIASSLCEQIGNMVSFTVLDDGRYIETASIGRRVCALSITSAPVAKGVILWANQLSNNGEYLSSAAYPTLSPSILSLLRIIAKHHPFCRMDILDLTFRFLCHANMCDMSFQRMQALRQQCFRLLLWLSTQGLPLTVLGRLASKLKGPQAEMDTALLRYFVGGFLELANPPYSDQFMLYMGTMLLTKRCVEALRSTYFLAEQKMQLKRLVDDFQRTVEKEKGRMGGDVKAVVNSLVSTYGKT